MNLQSNYLGFQLDHPLMVGASPLVDHLDIVKRLEDAGSSAIVMHSLFEEQISHDSEGIESHIQRYGESFAEALSYFPEPDHFRLGPDTYLNQIQKIRETVSVPVIASLNGTRSGAWFRYAEMIEEAGADALELNLYFLPTDPKCSASEIERDYIAAVENVVERLRIPVAVKLSPFFTALPQFVNQLEKAGARGVVLFNRFYQPDTDIENLELVPSLHLSDSSELLLRIRWIGILCGRTDLYLAASGGVHSAEDAIKAIMAGANAVQMTSAVLKHGPQIIAERIKGIRNWLIEHEYESLQQMQGSMSHRRAANPTALERANYMKIINSWTPDQAAWE